MKPHLNKVTLREVGAIEFAGSNGKGFGHKIREDNPQLVNHGDERLSLKTQGIFFHAHLASTEVPNSGYQPRKIGRDGLSIPNGERLFWGLTRSGEWIVIIISYTGEEGPDRLGYERARGVEILLPDARITVDMSKETLREAWRRLGLTIREWMRSREKLYKQACALSAIVGYEETVLSLIERS
jgi:hypothetical protein